MQHAKVNRSAKLDPRDPLVFDIRALGPASVRRERRVVPAPPELGSGLVRVPRDVPVEVAVTLAECGEGVLVTAEVIAPIEGECARCLDEFASAVTVGFTELFATESDGAGDDGYLLDGDLLDLEPALRDALVLELPLSPLCADDCQGLCGTCGVRLAEAGPGHEHRGDGGPWAVLADLFPAGEDGKDAGTTGPAGSKEQ